MVIKAGSTGPKRLTGAGTPATPWDYGKEFEFYERERERGMLLYFLSHRKPHLLSRDGQQLWISPSVQLELLMLISLRCLNAATP